MKKLRIYLDTSVISHLDQQAMPEKMAETHHLWKKIKEGAFDVVISDVTLFEINKCEGEKRGKLLGYLGEISYDIVAIDENTLEIAEHFVNLHILKQKSFDDCQHIAAAITSGCDAIVSWNFKHIVNHKTMLGVKSITALHGRKDVLIYAPPSLIGEDQDDL